MNFEELLGVLDSPLLGLHSIDQQLVIAGDKIFQAGQLYAERSYLLFDAFDARMATDRPPMPLDCFDKYVRQSMGVEFDRFVEPTRFLRFPNRVSEEGSRVFFAAGVEEVLAIIPEEPSMAAILDLAGDDQPTLWIQQVAQWLADFPGDSVSILEVWMALLLGDVGWSIVQTGDFYYASGLLVSRHQSLVKSKRLVKGD